MPPPRVLIIHVAQDKHLAESTRQAFRYSRFDVAVIDIAAADLPAALAEGWDVVLQIVSSASTQARGLPSLFMEMRPEARSAFERRSAALFLVFENKGQPDESALNRGQAIGWQRWRVNDHPYHEWEIQSLEHILGDVGLARDIFKRRDAEFVMSRERWVSIIEPLKEDRRRGQNSLDLDADELAKLELELGKLAERRRQENPPRWWALAWNLLTRIARIPTPFLAADVKPDEVHFTVTAPASIAPGANAELMIWAHIREAEQLVRNRAMAALGIASIRKLLSRSVGPIAMDKGTVISLVT